MSSRPLLITGLVGGVLAGVGLLGLALAVVAADGPALSPSTMAFVVLGAAAGWVLDGVWLSFAIVRLLGLDGGDEGGDGRSGPGPEPTRPSPPGEDPDWWPEFERDLRHHLDAQDRAPAAS